MNAIEMLTRQHREMEGAFKNRPTSAGSQNDVRYAFFADKRRLAVDLGDGVKVYDSADHRISGVQQARSGSRGTLVFTSQHGEVALATLEPA